VHRQLTAIQILESPRSQLQAERDEAIRNLEDVPKALEDQKQIALALARLGVPSPIGAEGSSVARPKLEELTDPPSLVATGRIFEPLLPSSV
jgi:hypothetical protein